FGGRRVLQVMSFSVAKEIDPREPRRTRRGERLVAVPQRAESHDLPVDFAYDDAVVAEDGDARLSVPQPRHRALAGTGLADEQRRLAGYVDHAAAVQLDAAPLRE